jgi:hypothetical protein
MPERKKPAPEPKVEKPRFWQIPCNVIVEPYWEGSGSPVVDRPYCYAHGCDAWQCAGLMEQARKSDEVFKSIWGRYRGENE